MRDFASCLTLSVMLAGARHRRLPFAVLLDGFVRLRRAGKEIAAVERQQLRPEDAES